MAYAPLTAALARHTGGSKDVDRPVSGSNRMEAGRTYDAVIVGVDTTLLESGGSVDFSLEDRETKATTNTRIWLVDEESGKVNWRFTRFLTAVLNDAKAVDMFDQAWQRIGDNTFNLFRGTTVKISMISGPGFKTHVTDNGGYILVNGPDSVQIAGVEFPTIEEAEKEGKSRGLKKSLPRVGKFEPVSDEVANANKEAFFLALEGVAQAIQRTDTH